jgi:hypothetical protein
MATRTTLGAGRRSSTEKTPFVEPAFNRLPDEIIQQYDRLTYLCLLSPWLLTIVQDPSDHRSQFVRIADSLEPKLEASLAAGATLRRSTIKMPVLFDEPPVSVFECRQ